MDTDFALVVVDDGSSCCRPGCAMPRYFDLVTNEPDGSTPVRPACLMCAPLALLEFLYLGADFVMEQPQPVAAAQVKEMFEAITKKAKYHGSTEGQTTGNGVRGRRNEKRPSKAR